MLISAHQNRRERMTVMERMVAIGGYRVQIDPDSNKVYISRLTNFMTSKPPIYPEGTYDSMDKAPLWAQERVAVLMMFDVEDYFRYLPPRVEGVGCRMSISRFWIYPPDASDSLTKPRKEN